MKKYVERTDDLKEKKYAIHLEVLGVLGVLGCRRSGVGTPSYAALS